MGIFLVDSKCLYTDILTGLTYTSSQNMFHEIMTNSGVKYSIMVGLLVRNMDEQSTKKIEAIPHTTNFTLHLKLLRYFLYCI